MDLRITLRELVEEHQLSPQASDRLVDLAGLDREPSQLDRSVPFGMAILAAVLGGLGIIFWVAANWESLGRSGRFALLQAVVVVMCVGALWRQAARLPLSMIAFLAIGGLFAYFGQTYQTGADPWQLFALWAALSLPLAAGVRHDAMWAAWALVAITAMSLWIHASTGHAWRVLPTDLPIHLAGWSAALLLTFALSPRLAHHTGAGVWSMRVALTLAVMVVMATALGGLFGIEVAPHYWLALLMLAGAGYAFSTPGLHDTFALSAVGLGLNVLLVAGLVRLLFQGQTGDPIIQLLVVGLVAAALLAGTVSLILKLSREHESEAAA